MKRERELAEGEEEPEFDSDEDIGATGGDLSLFWTLNRERAQARRGDDLEDEVTPLVYNVYAGSLVPSLVQEGERRSRLRHLASRTAQAGFSDDQQNEARRR